MAHTQDRTDGARRFPWRARAPAWALGAAAALAAGVVTVAAMTASAYRRSVALHAGLRAPADVLAVLASRSARVVALQGRQGASVRLVYDPLRRRGALVVIRLADPGQGLLYRVWLVDGGRPLPAGAFAPASDRTTLVAVRADFTRARAVAVEVGRSDRAAWAGTPALQAELASAQRRLRPAAPSSPPRRQ